MPQNKTIIDLQLAIDLYNQGKSQREIGRIFGCSQYPIKEAFRKANFLQKKGNKKYFYDEDYFSIINTPDKAYFLGLLYADGCNTSGNSSKIRIGLQDLDGYILDKFSKYIKSTTKLKFIKKYRPHWKDMYWLYIYNKKMSEDLINLGCVPTKSLILKFPTEEQVPSYLLNHFIRGYFDGDGCVCLHSKNKVNVSFIGTPEFLLELQNKVNFSCNIANINKIKIDKRGKNVACLNYSSKIECQKIRDWLYKDCEDLFLERKREKFYSQNIEYRPQNFRQ